MNVKMGLKRTSIVLAIFWAVGWSYVAWQGNAEVEMALAEIEYLEKQYPEGFTNQYFAKMHLNAIEQSNKGSAKMALAVRVGLFLPIVLLILSPFAWFIYRGFKPKLPPQSM